MAIYYSPVECEWLKSERLTREPGITLVECEDGIWRTPDEKNAWDAAAKAQRRF
jgi:hypothetical protein